MYTFIHPTKSGGTALEEHFSQHYDNYIEGRNHYNKCTPQNNPIIVLREPVDRFISMYKYWKYGSNVFLRSKEFMDKYSSYTIKDYIDLIKINDLEELIIDFTYNEHILPTSYWLNGTPLDKIIIIIYVKNLDEKMTNILKTLGIPDKKIPIPIVNITKNSEEKVTLDDDDLHFIRTQYKEDFDLYEKAQNQPYLFRKVL